MNHPSTYGHVVSSRTILIRRGIPKNDFALVLDPWVNLKGLQEEAAKEPNEFSREAYQGQIEEAKESLKKYFLENYVTTAPAPAANPSPVKRTPVKFFNFFSSEPKGEATLLNDLDEYFTQRPVGFGSKAKNIKPLQWWRIQSSQCPSLASLARDILSIPGK